MIKWTPKYDENYYTLLENCKVTRTWNKGTVDDDGRISINNCFKTREEAEEKAEKVKEILKGE